MQMNCKLSLDADANFASANFMEEIWELYKTNIQHMLKFYMLHKPFPTFSATQVICERKVKILVYLESYWKFATIYVSSLSSVKLSDQ